MSNVGHPSRRSDVSSSTLSWVYDILGIYILPILCFSVDYILEGVITTLYPVSVWFFAATGIGRVVA
jgi:hypothetical protein